MTIVPSLPAMPPALDARYQAVYAADRFRHRHDVGDLELAIGTTLAICTLAGPS